MIVDQFDVFKYDNTSYLVVLQNTLGRTLNNYVCCFTVPHKKEDETDSLFNLAVEVDEENHILLVDQMVTVDKRQLKNSIDNLCPHRITILNSIDGIFHFY